MLTEFREQRAEALTPARLTLAADAFVFSPDPACLRPWHPDHFTHAYRELADVLDIAEPLKNLRHFNATQLLASGVDLRTVAGRLGHTDGGATTLKVYANSLPATDRRAAEQLATDLAALRRAAVEPNRLHPPYWPLGSSDARWLTSAMQPVGSTPPNSARDRAADHRERMADERERAADDRERAADDREHLADNRDRAAENRDDVADDRDRAAGDRDRAAENRDDIAYDRERIADGRDRAAENRDGVRDDRERIAEERDSQATERQARETVAAEKFEAGAVRDQAEIDREWAATLRLRL